MIVYIEKNWAIFINRHLHKLKLSIPILWWCISIIVINKNLCYSLNIYIFHFRNVLFSFKQLFIPAI